MRPWVSGTGDGKDTEQRHGRRLLHNYGARGTRGHMKTLGTHLLADLHGCDPHILNDASRIETAMRQAAEATGCVVLHGQFHQFEPQGVTGLLLIAESHLSVHTWPEHGYAAVDLYTCGSTEPRDAIANLATALEATRTDWLTVERGREHATPSLGVAHASQPHHSVVDHRN